MGVYNHYDTMEDWLHAASAGDEEAAEAIFRRYGPAVLRLSVSLLGDLEDAEEVLQDTFVYALRNLRRFDAGKSALQTWLFTIAISRCRNKRRRKWLPVIPIDWLQKGETASGRASRVVEDWLAARGIRHELWAAVSGLSPNLREAVILRFVGGMTYAEIAQAAGCGMKAAESRVRTGLATLRSRLVSVNLEAGDWLAILGETGG